LASIVEVFDDNCGYKTLIKVSKTSSDSLLLEIQTNCSFIKKLAAAIGSNISRMEAVKSFNQNIMYNKLGEVMPGCTPCVVPCAIIKAIWAELGNGFKEKCKNSVYCIMEF
jgi:hypothetical protein